MPDALRRRSTIVSASPAAVDAVPGTTTAGAATPAPFSAAAAALTRWAKLCANLRNSCSSSVAAVAGAADPAAVSMLWPSTYERAVCRGDSRASGVKKSRMRRERRLLVLRKGMKKKKGEKRVEQDE